ncbi:MAG: hypothetical protein WCI73_08585 [Phycisphaerae bacterium]
MLIGLTLAAQSVGAIILLALGIIGLEVGNAWVKRRGTGRPWRIVRWGVAALLLIMMVGVIGRFGAAGKLDPWARHSEIGQRIVRLYRTVGRRTLLWRLSQEERHMGQALANPVLGTGRWDWWHESVLRGGAAARAESWDAERRVMVTSAGEFDLVAAQDGTGGRPWSLWMLIWGMYGVVGAMSVYVLLIWPAVRAWRQWPRGGGDWWNAGPTVVLAVLLWLTAADSLLNGAVLLPVMLVVGALSEVGRAGRCQWDAEVIG